MKKIFILGGGITGRLAKMMMPKCTVLEAKSSSDIFTAEVGVHISIAPIPELKNEKYTRYIKIDNQKPSLELIKKYKTKIEREGPTGYGDYRQFEPVQIVYKQEFPTDIDIRFDMPVDKIELSEKIIYYGEAGRESYDYLVSTIPLINLIRVTDMFEHFKDTSSAFFMHRPIYLLRDIHPTEKSVIEENYITDMGNPIYRENYVNGCRNRESLFKLENAIKIYPGKIYNNDQVPHILEDLNAYGIFCAGRYAEWDSRIHLWNSYSTLKFIKEMIYD